MNDTGREGAVSSLVAEARRRHVFRAAGLYAAAAFVILQLADIVFPAIGIPESVITWMLLGIAAGFPLVLLATWILDVTPDGIKVTPGLSPSERRERPPGRFIDIVIILVALGVGFLYLERFTTEEAAVMQEAEHPPAVEVEPSIAVLPFENLSSSEENAFFAAGIHEDILNHLSRIPELIVTSRTSTLVYQDQKPAITEIGRALNVAYILEGSVRRVGDQVRVSVQLIDAVQDKHLWSNAYDRSLEDIFAVQDQVAEEVADALKVQFNLGGDARPTDNLLAYEAFLEARALYNTSERENLELAQQKYQEAIDLDPEYADAFAGLSLAMYDELSVASNVDGRAKEAAERALALAPDSWLANFAMARYYAQQRLEQYETADPYFRKAIDINPNDTRLLRDYALALWLQGRAPEARKYFMETYRRNPLRAEGVLARAVAAVFGESKEKAREFTERALALDDDRAFLHWWAGNIYFNIQDHYRAARAYGTALEIDPNHFGAMLFLSRNVLQSLGAYDAAGYWLTKAEQIDPHNTNLAWRRADYLSFVAQAELNPRSMSRFREYVQVWLERDPDDIQAQRYEGYVPWGESFIAWEREEVQRFRELNQQGLETQLAYLERSSPEGEPVVQFWSSWSFLSAARMAYLVDEAALGDRLNRLVVSYYERQPDTMIKLLHVALANGMLGNRVEALHYLNALDEMGFVETQLLEVYGMTEDLHGIYHGLTRDVAFIDVLGRIRDRQQQTLAAIRRDFPELFPRDTSTL